MLNITHSLPVLFWEVVFLICCLKFCFSFDSLQLCGFPLVSPLTLITLLSQSPFVLFQGSSPSCWET